MLDDVIWECNVYDTVVPAQCELFYVSESDTLHVSLKKKNHGVHWPTFENEMVSEC